MDARRSAAMVTDAVVYKDRAEWEELKCQGLKKK
jgi:hypothetical protein